MTTNKSSFQDIPANVYWYSVPRSPLLQCWEWGTWNGTGLSRKRFWCILLSTLKSGGTGVANCFDNLLVLNSYDIYSPHGSPARLNWACKGLQRMFVTWFAKACKEGFQHDLQKMACSLARFRYLSLAQDCQQSKSSEEKQWLTMNQESVALCT